MVLKRRTDHGGSVAPFIIIGIILASGLITSIYFIKQHSEQVRRDQAIAIYEKEQAKKKKAESQQKTIASSDTQIETDDINLSDSSSYDGSSTLPETGPAENNLKVAGVFFLTVSIVGYLISKKELSRSL